MMRMTYDLMKIVVILCTEAARQEILEREIINYNYNSIQRVFISSTMNKTKTKIDIGGICPQHVTADEIPVR